MSTNNNKLYKKIIEFIEKNGEITHQTEHEMIVEFPIETLFDFISMCLSYFEKDEHPSIIIKGYEFEIDIMKIFEYYGIY